MTTFLTPFTFKNGVTMRYRYIMAPMTTYSANTVDTVSDAEITYYRVRSSGVSTVDAFIRATIVFTYII